MTSPTPNPSAATDRDGSLPFGTAVLLVLAALLYCTMLGSLIGFPEAGVAGGGAALAFAAISGVALWLVLALLMTIAAIVGRMTPILRAAAAGLLPLSAIAASVAIDLYGGRGNAWALAVPVLLPPMIAAYAMWVVLPGQRGMLTERWTTSVLGGGIVLFTLAPLVVALFNALPNSARAARQAAVERLHEDRLRQEERQALAQEAEQFSKLGPDSSLADYLPYFPGGDSRSREALAQARKVKSRQTDAVSLLKAGRINGLSDLFRLDIEVAREICTAYGQALGAEAAKITRERPDYLAIAIQLEQQLPNIDWLAKGGCDLDESLGLLAGNLRATSDTQRMRKFADTLSGYRRVR
jgi:hypothetical protein